MRHEFPKRMRQALRWQIAVVAVVFGTAWCDLSERLAQILQCEELD